MDKRPEIDSTDTVRMVAGVCRDVIEKEGWLSKLDAACGDGDHGVSMARGFRAVEDKLAELTGLSPGAVLRKVGMTLVSVIGGATGPLMGTLFIEAGKVAGESAQIDTGALAAMFRAGLEGVCRRGGAQAGEKTMVDALIPAVEALEGAAAEGAVPGEALRCAARAARTGAEATAAMVAHQGKARYLGERAVGHQDAGANSIVIILEALARHASGGCITDNGV